MSSPSPEWLIGRIHIITISERSTDSFHEVPQYLQNDWLLPCLHYLQKDWLATSSLSPAWLIDCFRASMSALSPERLTCYVLTIFGKKDWLFSSFHDFIISRKIDLLRPHYLQLDWFGCFQVINHQNDYLFTFISSPAIMSMTDSYKCRGRSLQLPRPKRKYFIFDSLCPGKIINFQRSI